MRSQLNEICLPGGFDLPQDAIRLHVRRFIVNSRHVSRHETASRDPRRNAFFVESMLSGGRV